MVLSRSWGLAFVVTALALGAVGSGALSRDPEAIESLSAITAVNGVVLVSHEGAGFIAAREGDLVMARDTIRTSEGASVEVTSFDGTSVRLEGDVQVAVESLHPTSARHDVGEKLHRTLRVLNELMSGSSRYNLHSPTSTASVRG